MENEELLLKAERELLDSWTGEPRITRARRVLLGGGTASAEGSNDIPDPTSLSAADLAGQLQKSVEAVNQVASFRKGYKGTSIKILREAACVVSAVGAELHGRTQNDENRRLREANAKMSGEIAELQKQLNELKGRVANMAASKEAVPPSKPTTLGLSSVTPPSPPRCNKRKSVEGELDPPSPTSSTAGRPKKGRGESPPKNIKAAVDPGMEVLMTEIVGRMMARFDARFAALESRLPPERLRPPLEAGKGVPAAAKARSFAEVAAAPSKPGTGGGAKGKGSAPAPKPSPTSQQATPTKGGKRVGGAGTAKVPATPTKASAPKPQRAAADNDKSDWTIVDRRGGKAGGRTGGAKAQAPAKKKAPPSKKGGAKQKARGKGGKAAPLKSQPPKPTKIRPPKQAAVLLSAEPAKEGEKAVALGDAIAGIRSSIKLADFGIASLKPKKAAGGGLLFEVPGQESGAKADKLAEALRTLLAPKGVRVSRPVKLAEIRVTGLDDSITPEEVREAIAGVGGCLAGEVSVGKLNRSPAGRLGSIWARCPAIAAKKVVDAGPLTVGWIRARVEALGARPLQCYRCLGVGHTRANCKEEGDRSGLCYRCGQPDHRASECSASPNCPYCAGKGLKAEHRYGGAACASLRPQRKKKGGKGNKTPIPPEKVGDKGVAQPTLERPPPNSEPQEGQTESLEEAMEIA